MRKSGKRCRSPQPSLHAVERISSACPHLMLLKNLLASISTRTIAGSIDRDVEGLAYDSRRVQKNTLFVALRGEKTDGHAFVDQAVEKGASVIVAEREAQQTPATW